MTMTEFDHVKVGIIGAGSWGLSLARKLALKQHDVTVWVFEEEEYNELTQTHHSQDFLPEVTLPDSINFSMDLSDFVDFKYIVNAVPSHAVRTVFSQFAQLGGQPEIAVNVAKGVENDTLKRMSEVLLEELASLENFEVVTLSGPTHAEEVSRDIPTAIVAASDSQDAAKIVQSIFMDGTFRVYTNHDIIGTELGGSLKNVIAIAAGIIDGIGYGDNSKAALITRGITEITRLGMAAGAKEETFSGLSGIGDLIVTCLSQHSRNRYVGEQIGLGKTLDDILSHMKMVAEGVKTTKSVHQMSEKYGVEMPISEQIYQVLFNDKDPQRAVQDLMTRDPVHERHSM